MYKYNLKKRVSIRSFFDPSRYFIERNNQSAYTFSNVGKSSVFFSCLPTCDQHTMLADRFEHRPQHESSVPHRLCVRGFDSKETHSRHVKRINVEPVACVRVREGEGGGGTSVKAIYVNAETRILIYILCGSNLRL